MPIVTLAEAKAHLNLQALDDDAELQRYIDSIAAAVEHYKHEVIEQRTITETLTLCGRPRFRLWSAPVISLTTIDAADGSLSWDPDDMLATASGRVHVLTGGAPTGLVTAVYEAGYTTIPGHYAQGALVILQHAWETQRGVGTIGAGVIGAEETYNPQFSFSIPRKALEWLGAPRPLVG